MKKVLGTIALMLAIILTLLSVFTGCADNDKDKDKTITIADEQNNVPDKSLKINVTVLSGTTGIGAAKLISDSKAGNTALTYDFNIISDATAVAPSVIGKTADIVMIPTNLASVLYKKTDGNVKVLALNTLGVLYIIENGETVNSLSSLRGKTVYIPGQGTNPEYILKYILEKNGMTVGKDVIFDYTYSTPDTLAAAVAGGLAPIALLPEPKVTVVKSKNSAVRSAVDLTAEWDKIAVPGSLAQGCVVVRKDFADAHPAEVKAFLDEYKKSVEFVNSDTDAASVLVAEAGIIPQAALAKKAIPFCNIKYIEGAQMKASLSEFFNILYSVAPASVGGAVPDEGIYYSR